MEYCALHKGLLVQKEHAEGYQEKCHKNLFN